MKIDADGNVSRYNVRLVPKGYTQYGIDYRDIFAPVSKINTTLILMSVAINQDWPLKQILGRRSQHGYLEGEVNMEG